MSATLVKVRVVDTYVFRKIQNGYKFLMLKRAETKIYEHLWQGVAGKMEEGETAWQAAVRELKEYIADYMKISPACVVVRTPGEPTEEYQEQIANATKSDYKNKLHDIEYKDAPKVTSADWHSTKANMSLLKELLKDTKIKYMIKKIQKN